MHLTPPLLVILTTSLYPTLTTTNQQHHYHSPSSPLTDLTTWEQIHTTLTTYALAIDTKDFAQFASVFTQDAHANYTSFLSNLAGLPAIQASLQQAVATIDTQHLLGSITIDIADDGQVALANATTYFQASLFGKGGLKGKVLYQYGLYRDDLLLIEGGGWRIMRRELVFQGPGMVGDLAVIGM